MKIIPAINCPDFDCVKEKLEKAVKFFSDLPADDLSKEGWAQIDIADGKFTLRKTWNNPGDLITNYQLPIINLEFHLMVENPESVIDDWIETFRQNSGRADRIIVHLEALRGADFEKYKSGNAEIGLAINPETPVEKLIPYLDKIKFVQILAVNPGLSGQNFQQQVLKKIKFLKDNYPDVIIEVDGGINLETAKLCKEAGADILISGSYIWDGENPKAAFDELAKI